MKNKKLIKITATQSFSPIKEIKSGVVITKDNRYIKILEFTPINFLLRSSNEQASIIAAFASSLKAFPVKLQFKVISKKADISMHVNTIRKCMAKEENSNCKVLQTDQIKMITRIGSSQGVSRRFFLIFEYERALGSTEPSFDEILHQLYSAERRITQLLLATGNEIVSDASTDYLAKTIATIFSRKSTNTRPFEQRKAELMLKYKTESLEDIPINDLLCPNEINTKLSPKYLTIDGLYYSFFYIPSSAYPTRCTGGWMSFLINFADGIDVDIFAEKEPTQSVQTKLTYAMRLQKMKLNESDDTSQGHEELISTLGSAYFIKEGLSQGEDFYYMAVLITVTAETKEELDYKTNELKNACISQGLKIKPYTYQMTDALLASLPLCHIAKPLFKKARRNALTTSLAAAYPFISFEITDEHGVMLGINRANNSLVFLDPYDSTKYKNANMVILGQAGSGKTYTLQCLALRMRQMDNQVIIIAPDKGHEFKRACTAIGGQYINIATGSNNNINIMEIRKMDMSTSIILDGEEEGTSILAQKMQQLHTFFTLLIPDISYEERQLLDEALIKTYEKFGISADNSSLNDPKNPGNYKKMPILGDLHEELKAIGPRCERLYNILTRYVTGSAASFNAPTNVNLDNKYIVINLTSLTEELLPIGMFIVLDYIWDKIREDRTKPKAIIMDELWELIGAKSSKEAARFVLRIFKVIRGYAGSAIGATQDLNDFFALENGAYGKGIINNSNIKIVMNLDSEELERVRDTLKLTDSEILQISRFQRGEGLLAVNTNHVLVDFEASSSENDLITTDPRQLRELAERMKKNKGEQYDLR